MHKSRFAERVARVLSTPQLRRFAACSGLRIDVPLRGTLAASVSFIPQLRRFAACSGLRMDVPLRGTVGAWRMLFFVFLERFFSSVADKMLTFTRYNKYSIL